MSAARPKVKNAFLIGTISVVFFLFIYYFLAYIPYQENEMRQRGIRIVNRMANNLKEKENHYEKSISNFSVKYKTQYECQVELEAIAALKDTAQIRSKLLTVSCFWKMPNMEEKMKSYDDKMEKLFKSTDSLLALSKNNLIEQTKILTNEYNEGLRIFKQVGLLEVLNQQIHSIDQKVKIDSIANKNEYIYWNVTNWKKGSKDTTQSSSKIILGIKPDEFTGDMKRFEFFDDIFLVAPETGKIVDRSKFSLNFFDINTLPETKIEGEENLVLDDEKQFSGVRISEKKISNNTYYSYSRIVKIQHTEYHLTALIDKDKYTSQVRAVSIWVVTLVVIFLVFLVQILPVMKPFLLNKKERLQSSDMMWAGISVIFGMAALSLLAISLNTYDVEEIDLIDEKLDTYNNTIENSFVTETNLALNLLSAYKQDTSKTKNRLVQNHDLQKMYNHQKPFISFLGIQNNGNTFDYFNIKKSNSDRLTFWDNKTPLDLKHRIYYRIHTQVDSVNVWKTKAYNNNEMPYYVASIYSMSSGKHETTVSVKHNSDSILALVYPFKSVNNRYIEPNYTYAIIDKTGDIKYHSDSKKIGSENFFDEALNNENLMAFVRNDADTSFDLKFSLIDYRAHIKPISGTDWHVLTLFEIKQSRLTITSSLAIAIQFVIAILLYLISLHFILKIQRARDKKFKKRSFSYWFLNPLSINKNKYIELLVINVGVMLFFYLIYETFVFQALPNLLLYLGTITAAILYNFVVLNEQRHFALNNYKKTSVEFSVFETILCVFAATWAIIFLVFFWHSGNIRLFSLPIFGLLALVIFEKINPRGVRLISVNKLDKNQYRPYYFHTLSWVLILGVVPTLLMFKPVYNVQHIKRTASDLAQEKVQRLQLQNWEDTKQVCLSTINEGDKKDYDRNNRSIALLEFLDPYFENDGAIFRGQHKSKMDKIYFRLNQDSVHGQFLTVGYQNNSSYLHQKPLKENSILAFSLPSILQPTSPGIALFFWLFFILNLLGLYVLIKKLSEKFFYLKLTRNLQAASPSYFQNNAIGNENLHADQVMEIVGISPDEMNIFFVGAPYSGRQKLALQTVKNTDKIEFLDFQADFNSVLEMVKQMDLNSPIMILNFDHRIYDFEHNLLKLNLIENILSSRSKHHIQAKLIIISSFDIYQLMDIYQEKINQLQKDKANANTAEIAEKRTTLNRWETALFSFSKHIVPLKQEPAIDFISQELQHGHALQKLIPRVRAYNLEIQSSGINLSDVERKVKLIEAILDMAENYYFALWNSCSREEKFLLLDLAEDGLLNAENQRGIYGLVRKGIVILKPHLSIFNQSFKYFIQESISAEETKEMEQEAKAQGSWKTYQYLVIFLVVVILIFLSFAEKQAVAQITTLVSLSAVLFPNIVKILGSVTSRGNIFNKN